MQDLRTWTCGHCKRTILVPPMGEVGYPDALARIREHRFGHLTDALMHGSDEDLWGLSGDEPGDYESPETGFEHPMSEIQVPVDADDLAPVLEGIEGLLRDDLPRALKFWYPINEDGSFNR